MRGIYLQLLGVITTIFFLMPVTNAAQVDFVFTGVVDSLDSSLTSEFSLGENVVGSYTVDDSSFLASDLIVTIGDDYTLTADTGYVSVVPGIWIAVAFSGVTSGINGAPVGGNGPLYFDIQLFDSNDVLESGVLPLDYTISEFGSDLSNINFPDDSNRLDFEVLSIETSAIPVPAAVWLFGSALGLLGWLRRKAA